MSNLHTGVFISIKIHQTKSMKHSNVFIVFIFIIYFKHLGYAQTCSCLISEVETNTVSPCNYTIGTLDTVTNATEFRNAVSQANSSGGNRTILIADGTYQIASPSWYPYITANNIVFKSLSGNRDAVILTGTGMAATSGTEIGIYAVGDNITIADLTIKDVGNHGIAVTGDNLYVYNVKIQDTYEQMIKGNSTAGGINNGTVKCSLFEYTNGIGPQWYIGGLDIHTGINWNVSDNVFYDIASPSVAVAEHAVHFWDSSEDNVVERNKIVNCDRGIGFGLGSSPNTRGVIKNNMITNDGSNLFADVGIGLESSPNTEVYNNSIFIQYPNAIEYRFATTTNIIITNNLTNQLIRSRNGGTATLTTNNTGAMGSWFVDATSGNLRLANNIPSVVDMGTSLVNDVTVDLDQVTRPQMGSYDIGATEYLNPTTGLKDTKAPTLDVTVFPNPSANVFTLQSKEISIDNITIYNAVGQTIASFEGDPLPSTFVIDAQQWEAGVYFCHIAGSNAASQLIRMVVLE
jgi:hypothetical protein